MMAIKATGTPTRGLGILGGNYYQTRDGMNTASPVAAGSFAIGTNYIINSIGTTNFVTIGASANTVGLTFLASGVGSGSGTATPIAVTYYDGLNSGGVISQRSSSTPMSIVTLSEF